MAKILIIEDEETTGALLSRALTAAGYQVSVATDGEDGVAKAIAEKPQLVIMDMFLPKMTGYEATRALKADPATRSIPIVALTSATTFGDRDDAYLSGCDSFHSKPIDMPSLLASLKELIKS